VRSERPQPMESLGQAYGYILYRTTLAGPASGELAINDLRDYAQVYLDGVLVGTLDRRQGKSSVLIRVPADKLRLDILVENSGHINFGPRLRDDRKGITKSVTFAGTELTGWNIHRLPLSNLSRVNFSTADVRGPAFYRGTFHLARTGDTFLDLRGMGKGTVWVNGHHLGRFWNVGPQQTLYVPASWLKPGANTVVVFSLAEAPTRTIRGLAAPVLDELTTAGDQ
jgi:beta-galactosidase